MYVVDLESIWRIQCVASSFRPYLILSEIEFNQKLLQYIFCHILGNKASLSLADSSLRCCSPT